MPESFGLVPGAGSTSNDNMIPRLAGISSNLQVRPERSGQVAAGAGWDGEFAALEGGFPTRQTPTENIGCNRLADRPCRGTITSWPYARWRSEAPGRYEDRGSDRPLPNLPLGRARCGWCLFALEVPRSWRRRHRRRKENSEPCKAFEMAAMIAAPAVLTVRYHRSVVAAVEPRMSAMPIVQSSGRCRHRLGSVSCDKKRKIGYQCRTDPPSFRPATARRHSPRW